MKVYIKAVVSIQNLREQFAPDMDEDLFEEIISIDPTANYASNRGGKYCPWLFRQWNEGNLTEDSDFNTLRDDLKLFARKGKKFINSDIGKYKTVDEFRADADNVLNMPLTDKELLKSAKAKAKEKSTEDIKFIVEDDTWEVYTPLTWAGAIALAYWGVDKEKDFTPSNPTNMKARWCTAGESVDRGKNHYDYYTGFGPLYVFIPKNDPINKYQACFAHKCYWYDKFDHEQGKSAWLDFCSKHPIIAQEFDVVTKDGIQYMAGSIVGFDSETKVLKIPDDIHSITEKIPQGVEEVYLPDTMTSLQSRMFKNRTALRFVKLPSHLQEIPEELFFGCSALESVAIPDSVAVYRKSAFEQCTNLRTVKNSTSVTQLCTRCFAGCTSLANFSLPASVTDIEPNCFTGAGFAEFEAPAGLTVMKAIFRDDSSIEKVVLNNVTELKAYAFMGSSISDIDLSNVQIIGSGAFRDCPNLTSIRLPEGILIENGAFQGDENLQEINVPINSQLGLVVFDDCPNLTVRWEDGDLDYPFDNIGLLICDESCKELINTNKGWVKIQTLQGTVYEVDEEA